MSPLDSSMALVQSAAPKPAPVSAKTLAGAQKAAKEYEGVFISQFLGSMFQGISTDGPFGGGTGEAMFRSLMIDQYGKQIEAHGGFGLAAAMTKQLLAQQEMHS